MMSRLTMDFWGAYPILRQIPGLEFRRSFGNAIGHCMVAKNQVCFMFSTAQQHEVRHAQIMITVIQPEDTGSGDEGSCDSFRSLHVFGVFLLRLRQLGSAGQK